MSTRKPKLQMMHISVAEYNSLCDDKATAEVALAELKNRYALLSSEHAKDIVKAQAQGKAAVLFAFSKGDKETFEVMMRSRVFMALANDRAVSKVIMCKPDADDGNVARVVDSIMAMVKDLQDLSTRAGVGKTDTVYSTPLTMDKFELLLSCCDMETLRKFAVKMVSP